MANGTGAPASTQLEGEEPAHVRQLRTDLDEAVETLSWQRRVIARYRSLLISCEDQGRAPTRGEIAEAMAHDEQRLAA